MELRAIKPDKENKRFELIFNDLLGNEKSISRFYEFSELLDVIIVEEGFNLYLKILLQNAVEIIPIIESVEKTADKMYELGYNSALMLQEMILDFKKM